MSKIAKKEKVALDKLGELTKGMTLSLPKLPELPELSSMETSIDEAAAQAHEIVKGVNNAAKFLGDVRRQMVAYDDSFKRKAAEQRFEVGVSQAANYIEQVLGLADSFYKTAAAVAYITAVATQQFANREEANAALADLTNRKLLIKMNMKGPIQIGYQHYEISDTFGMKKDDVAEVSAILAKFSRILMTLEKQLRQDAVRNMATEVDITLDEALAGKNGKCIIEVPAEAYMDREGKELYRPGGTILLRFDKNRVYPETAIGACKKMVSDMAEMDVCLMRYTLDVDKWQIPPGSGKEAFQKMAFAVRKEFDLSESEAEDHVRRIQACWFIVHRGVAAHKQKTAREQAEIEMKEKSDITAAEFFGLNGSAGKPVDGTAMLKYSVVLCHEKKKSYLPSLLVKRTGNEIEVIEVSPIHEQFVQFVGQKFEADSYPKPLDRLLNGIKRQEEMAIATAKK